MNDKIFFWNEGSSGYAEVAVEDILLRGNFQLELLKRKQNFLLPIEMIELNEDRFFEAFQVGTYINFSQNNDLTEIEKQLLLVNVGKFFFEEKRIFTTTFDPENIYFTHEYDIGFGFRILKEMCKNEDVNLREFTEYQALVLSVLQKKYTYTQLIDTGIDVLDTEEDLSPFIEAQTSEEIYHILCDMYENNYKNSKKTVIGLPIKKLKIILIVATAVFFILFSGFTYFAYQSFNVTNQYQIRMNIYQAHYNKDANRVVELSEKLTDDELDETLKIVVADSLIASNQEENLVRAFYLDSSRQIECIEQLVELEDYDDIANLRSDKNKVQLYQAFYAKDYKRAITLAENNLDLKYDAQAQILLSRAYVALHNYSQAIDIIEKLGDKDLQLEVYKLYREDVSANQTNVELRREILDILDSMIEILESETTENSSEGALL